MKTAKIISLLALIASITFAIIQNESFSYFPTVLAIVFSLIGFGIAFYVRRKNKKDIWATCLVFANALIWVGYGLFMAYMTWLWHPFG